MNYNEKNCHQDPIINSENYDPHSTRTINRKKERASRGMKGRKEHKMNLGVSCAQTRLTAGIKRTRNAVDAEIQTMGSSLVI